MPRWTAADIRWTAADIPDQSGRIAVVTGANSGLGFVVARELARAGAHVLMACRDVGKAEAAAGRIREAVPRADVEVVAVDLADLASVRACAEGIAAAHEWVDVLINNAGIMAAPRRLTGDGFESQLATNHLGHFALTGLLLAKLLAAAEPRVVTETSLAHRIGRIAFSDLRGERRYRRWGAYAQSKLANLMFCFELQRRAAAAGTRLKSIAAHPGYARTNLQFAAPPPHERAIMAVTNLLFGQSAEMGALPTLYAATAPDLPGGSVVGPDGLMQRRGHPRVVGAARHAYDQNAWRRLWDVSEQLTGVRYQFVPATAVG
jgi:NAD(P)-dependent dehydrogenase (short-subunit alcohol dehydrogenase family)